MAQYNIYTGLSGSFGGATYQYTSDFGNCEEAEEEAWEQACEQYESYEGLHGLISYIDCIKDYCQENNISDNNELTKQDYEEIDSIYNNYREAWIEYYVIPAEEDIISKNELKIL